MEAPMLEYLTEKLPLVEDWIDETIRRHEKQAVSVQSLQFPRLPLYYTDDELVRAKVVVIDAVPVIPLTSMGLTMFQGFEKASYKGITYRDTYFIEAVNARLEAVHFHELVHVVQWRVLGTERFMLSYAEGFLEHGYYGNPLERMAYEHQQRFIQYGEGYPVSRVVGEEIRNMPPPHS
jgi:hypothetical protein